MSTLTELYDQDFYAWTQRNADLLRQGRAAEIDQPEPEEDYQNKVKYPEEELPQKSSKYSVIQHFVIVVEQVEQQGDKQESRKIK